MYNIHFLSCFTYLLPESQEKVYKVEGGRRKVFLPCEPMQQFPQMDTSSQSVTSCVFTLIKSHMKPSLPLMVPSLRRFLGMVSISRFFFFNRPASDGADYRQSFLVYFV